MKNHTFILSLVIIIVVLIQPCVCAQGIGNEVAELISTSYDLSYSGLDKEAKTKIIEAIHNKHYADYEAPLRFALGQLCYFNEQFDGAAYQWIIVSQKYPESEEALVIKMILNLSDFTIKQEINDILFLEEYDLSKYMWNPKRPNTRIDLQELNDPLLAIEYLYYMLHKYDDCGKSSIILYDLFLLFMGYNDNGFGYHNIQGYSRASSSISFEYFKQNRKAVSDGKISIEDSDDISVSVLKNFLFEEAKAISDTLKSMSCASYYYIRTQFLLGVSLSGTKLFSSKIDLKPESKPYLENIVFATEGDPTNIYRIFAIKWCAALDKKGK